MTLWLSLQTPKCKQKIIETQEVLAEGKTVMRLHVIPCITDDAQARTARAKPGGATELGMFGVKRGYKCMPGKGK